MKKTLVLIEVIFVLSVFIKFGYPAFHRFIRAHDTSNTYYQYTPGNIQPEVDLSSAPPAVAVPILMYHGVVSVTDSENTDQSHFIAQMEMLKRQGYQTITLQNFDDFLHGNFVLPPRPIIITFDDGRKDSYFPTDDIFKKLGFKATIFEVSGKANDGDGFYLSWENLKTMVDSGRWDVQAHGTYSHNKIYIDDKGTVGRFLTSRQYLPSHQLESIAEFNHRVEQDYLQNIKDIQAHLGYTPKFFAIPLNDYGESPITNYPDASDYNHNLIIQNFNQAYIEINDPSDVNDFHLPAYNYQDADPYRIARIEVKNMSAEDLKNHLDQEFPRPPSLDLSSENIETFKKSTQIDYAASMNIDTSGLHLISSTEVPSSRVLFGESHWSGYTVEMTLSRVKGRSAVLLAYLSDPKKYISFGVSGNGIFLRQTIDDQETELVPSAYLPILPLNSFKLVFSNHLVDAYYNNRKIFSKIPIKLNQGRVGFKVWDDNGDAEGLLKSIKIYPTL